MRSAVKRVTTLSSNTDGMTCDRQNNLFMTALEPNGVMLRDAKTGEVSTYVSHPEMSWPRYAALGSRRQPLLDYRPSASLG